MAKRSKSQHTGSLGQRRAALAFEETGTWIVRMQEEDFGVDMELELANQHPTGHFIKSQVKASDKTGSSVRLRNSFLRYAYESRVPFLLIHVRGKDNPINICWLQGCIEQARLQKSIYGSANTTLIKAEWLQPLNASTNDELIRVARGVHPISLAMMIRSLIGITLEMKDLAAAGLIVSLLRRYNAEMPYFPIGIVIDEIVSLGDRVWATTEGNALTALLFELCRAYPDHFSREQICKLVIRPHAYSRTGINALSILYDEQPLHLRSLELPDEFSKHADWRPSYFCSLREKYEGTPVTSLMFGDYDCTIGSYQLDPRAKDGLNKWANRGDCAILDYAYDSSAP